jgi:large subunit ribosomal protein L30
MNIKITQVKSGIDRSERQKKTLVALGLRKLNASREVEATPQILGMVKKVSHLVKVDTISEAPKAPAKKIATEKVADSAPVVVIEAGNESSQEEA